MILRRVPSALTIPIGVAIGILLTASPAWGHAALVSSDPEPGAELSTSPGVVTLAFSEPLNVKLSNATVASPDGDTFEGTASPENRIAIPVTTNAPGVYVVEWTTVSTLDGHPLHGSFAFGVGVSPGAAGEGSVATGPNEGGLLLGLVRAVEYASLFAAMGMLLLRRLARKEPPIDWVRPRIRVALVTALVSGTTVVMAEAALAAGSPSLGRIATTATMPRCLSSLGSAIALRPSLAAKTTAPTRRRSTRAGTTPGSTHT